VSDEDSEARLAAISHVDQNPPMALDAPDSKSPLRAENPKKRRTSAEVAAERAAKQAAREQAKLDKILERERVRAATAEAKAAARAERERQREQAKLERAQERVRLKEQARLDKIAVAEGGRVDLPAIVFRHTSGAQPRVVAASDTDAWAVIETYLKHLFVDCEHSGYPIGHALYELRTVQLGGEDMAVVFDATDPAQMQIVSLALAMCEKLTAHSAGADAIPLVYAGAISWDDIWAKMHDSVLYLKLTDPKLSGSDASKLKEVSSQMLHEYAVSPAAEVAKNDLFKAMGCLLKTEITTPPERNGWYMVSKNSKVMAIYAGSDVLDLAAVMRMLPELPVDDSVLQRERWFEAKCARVAYDGFKLDHAHIASKIVVHEKLLEETQRNVSVLSDGKIANPKSPEVIGVMKELYPGIDFTIKDKKTREYKDSAGKAVLERVKGRAKEADPLLYHLADQILEHRHHATTLGLLYRPLENLCLQGDSRMRPTVYTINADTGRCSCVRPNGQQFSRQGGVRASVIADPGWCMCNADFEGCEIRVAAGLSGDRALLEAEISPKCYRCDQNPCACGAEHTGLHWMAAHAAFGYEAIKEHRYWCKRGIFCKLFGGGPETAAQQVYCDVEPMRRIFSAFEELAPVYTAWDLQLRQAFKDGTLVWRDYATGENKFESLYGKQRGIYRTYSGRQIYINAPHAFGNYAIQGTARELLVDGVIRWSQTKWGNRPLLPIHDELLLWVPEADFEEATMTLKRCMETNVLSSPGFEVHIGADPELKRYTYWPDSS
jgi:DNA polymerase I-like protein with 3'-5' exonuclease and polymerase domains